MSLAWHRRQRLWVGKLGAPPFRRRTTNLWRVPARMPPREPLESHAREALEAVRGRTLVLWPAPVRRRLPPEVSCTQFFEAGPDGIYDSIVSVGQLGTASDLAGLLMRLRPHMGPESVLYFCEPTVASDTPTAQPPHDVTTSLWTRGFTVFLCRRARHRSGRHIHEYCWGRARLRSDSAPPAKRR